MRGFFMQKYKYLIFAVIKSVIFSLLFSLILILLFAIIVKSTNLSPTAIRAVNQFIKIISLFLGCFLCVKENKGLIKGIITGLFYTVLLYVIFTIFGENAFGIGFLLDLVFGVIAGAVSGIISVNLRK